MRLTVHTDYALRTLMFLALEPGSPRTIEDIAKRYGISRNHLKKVAQTLVQAGFVDSLRGRGGGLKLAREPATLKLGDIVRATEDGFAIVECFDAGRNTCIVSAACGLRNPLQEALSAFLSVLDRYTIADLVRNPATARRMHRLLSFEAGATH